MQTCICCNRQLKTGSTEINEYKQLIECENCGIYLLTDSMFMQLHQATPQNIYLISGYIREQTDKQRNSGISDDYIIPIELSKKTYNQITNDPNTPKTLTDKLNKFLMHYFCKTSYYGEKLLRDPYPAICYSKNEDELTSIETLAQERNLIKISANNSIELTHEGIERCEQLSKKVNSSNTAFVAMWFNEQVNSVYESSIKSALNKCGFNAFRVDEKQHNGDITDEIIAGIKSSRFMIADFTGNRGGVYYEAGFARGLGLPVIYTCHKDYFGGQDADGKRVHFDINHLNFIVWDDPEEFKQNLINRIKATILTPEELNRIQ